MTNDHSPVVVVSGWAGSTNLGDELLGLAMVNKLRTRGVEPLVVSTNPELSRERLDAAAIDHRSWPSVLREIRRSSALVFGGGGLIQDSTSHLNVPYHLARPWLATRTGTPFAAIGLGAGPLRSRPARAATRRVLSRARAIGVRDEASAEVLRGIGLPEVVVTADLALSLPVPTRPAEDRIVVALRPPIPGGLLPAAARAHVAPDDWVDAAALALDATATSTGLAIHFLPMQTDRDDALHRSIAERMTTPVSHASPTLTSVLDDVASAQMVIAMRYHAALGALLAGRPSVLLGYAPKVEALAGELDGGFELVGSDAASLASIPQAILRVTARAERVAAGRERLRLREQRNDGLLDDLLAAS